MPLPDAVASARPPSCWRAQRYPSALLLVKPRVLTCMIIARSHAQRRAARARQTPAAPCRAPDTRSARTLLAMCLGTHARKPTHWSYRRSIHRALPARLPSSADYIRRGTEPESIEIMLCLLIVALPLVVALPAAFDKQEVNVLQFEAQSPLQFEVRSPPESRIFSPLHKPPHEINTIVPPKHTPLRTHNAPSAYITMDAPRH